MKAFFAFLAFLVLPAFPAWGSSDPIKVGLVLDKGGVDDKSFNAAAYNGAMEAKQKLGVMVKSVTASDDAAIEPSLRSFAQKGFQLVIGIGFVMGDPILKVAKEFPNTHFLLVDSEAKASNVRSVIFQEHEGSFLVGAIAALTSKTNTVGFVGGMDIPLIKRFEMGYKAGAQAVTPKIEVLVNYVGSTSDAWKNPMKGKELALSQYHKKADVIFAAAGASGLGVFDAAEQMKKFAIGVDSNQNWIKPGLILTSMVKRIDRAVYDAIDDQLKGKFKSGVYTLGVAEGAVDYVIDEHNKHLFSKEMEKKIQDLKSKIITKKIKVPDYYILSKSLG